MPVQFPDRIAAAVRPANAAPLDAAARLLIEATSAGAAQQHLEAWIARRTQDTPNLITGPETAGGPLPALDANTVANARLEADVRARRLQQVIRALRREGVDAIGSTPARVLVNDALRWWTEMAGYRWLAEQVAALPGAQTSALHDRAGQALQAQVQQLLGLLAGTRPDRHLRIATLLFGSQTRAAPSSGAAAPVSLSEHERAALVDILHSADRDFGTAIRETVDHGGDLTSVRGTLHERLLAVSLSSTAAPAPQQGGAVAGLVFDLGVNKWVPKDQSWSYPIKLGQLFDYVVDGIIDGREQLQQRLQVLATEPFTDEAIADHAAIARFVDALAWCGTSTDPRIRALLDVSLTMCFATTDSGDKPVAAIWELPVEVVAQTFRALSTPDLRDRVLAEAELARAAHARRQEELRAPLKDLLDRYPGIPKRHKRAHGALINLGLAGQSLGEMDREGGVLPRSQTLLEPHDLPNRYATADHLKLRFLMTDEFELYVISDDQFQDVVRRFGFPPNHELLSKNHPIAGSGYLTVHQGSIVALEDDIVMLPGKLPAGLPPALEVLRARGYTLDEERIAEASRVVDWEGFSKAVLKPGVVTSDVQTLVAQGDIAPARAYLEGASHAERPQRIAMLLQARLQRERTQQGSEAAARQETATFVQDLLAGFRIINTSARDFRDGHLPAQHNEFSDLLVDQALAPYLVRRLANVGSA